MEILKTILLIVIVVSIILFVLGPLFMRRKDKTAKILKMPPEVIDSYEDSLTDEEKEFMKSYKDTVNRDNDTFKIK